jgi:hypothetical protein
VLLEHPFLVGERYEEIAALHFPESEPELDGLRREILEIERSGAGLDAVALRQHLGRNGFATTVDTAVAALGAHARFIARNSDPDSVRLYWAEVIRMIRRGDQTELASASEAFTRDSSEENSARLVAVRERALQEGLGGEDHT